MAWSVPIVNCSTYATPFRGIAWVNEYDRNPGQFRFVFDKDASLDYWRGIAVFGPCGGIFVTYLRQMEAIITGA